MPSCLRPQSCLPVVHHCWNRPAGYLHPPEQEFRVRSPDQVETTNRQPGSTRYRTASSPIPRVPAGLRLFREARACRSVEQRLRGNVAKVPQRRLRFGNFRATVDPAQQQPAIARVTTRRQKKRARRSFGQPNKRDDISCSYDGVFHTTSVDSQPPAQETRRTWRLMQRIFVPRADK